MYWQRFQPVAPRDKLAAPVFNSGLIGCILFAGEARNLVRLLAIPVRPRYSFQPVQPQRARCTATKLSTKLAKTTCTDERGRKRSSDEEVQVESSRVQKRAKTEGWIGKRRSDTVVTLFSLPSELHWLIFSLIDDVEDVVSFGLANQYFWSIAQFYVETYYTSTFGRWAGKNIVCVGNDVQTNDYPQGLFSAEELEVLRHRTTDIPDDWETPNGEVHMGVRFTLEHFAFPNVSTIEKDYYSVRDPALELLETCGKRGIREDPAFRQIRARLTTVEDDTYFPPDQKWILRNLTTKQIVRADAIALSPEYIRGPSIDVLGFGEVVASRICWSTYPPDNMKNATNISRGVWAGHRLDITTLSRHEAETCASEWSDASDEVCRDIAAIWEAEYGECWQDIIRDEWDLKLRFEPKRRGI
ncbi:hypothetical protein NUW58_g392 [Xylaria curta]|uniref:Uncharacterized protein n=1 Tax=Xylaria curta TaxID=42375 RepID=A0ACC1PQT3_9PEZI|nr:hypothetical protein NUW58_g392 [Xylaria curta]